MRILLIILLCLMPISADAAQKVFGNLEVETNLIVHDTDDEEALLKVQASNHRIGINEDDPTVALEVVGDVIVRGNDASGLVVSGASLFVDEYTQLGTGTDFQAFYQENGDLYSNDGKFYIGKGLNSVAERYGVGLQIREQGLDKTLDYSNIDATFTASTATVYKAGQTFVTDGVVIGDFMVVTGSTETVDGEDFTGSTGEVLSVTEDTIIVSMAAAGQDSIIDLTGFNFVIFGHPIVSFLDNGDLHMNIGSSPSARLHIQSDYGNNIHSIDMDVTAGVDGHAGFNMDLEPGTKSDVAGFEVNYGASQFTVATQLGIGYELLVLNDDATAGNVHGLEVAVSDPTNTSLEVEAVAARRGVDVIGQYLSDLATLDVGFVYDASATSYTDRTTEFTSTGSNISIFVEDNDQILLASTAQWDYNNFLLATNSSQAIIPTFEYIENDGTWTSFLATDQTNGFTQSGNINWNKDNLTDWGQRTVNEVTGEAGAVDYYWIRITRTRNTISPNVPTESIITIRTRGSKYNWDKNGEVFASTFRVEPVSSVWCGAAVLGKIYYDSDDNTFYGCNNAGWQAFH